MLGARRIHKTCQSCRLQLLSIFENGFTTPTASSSRFPVPSRLSASRIQSHARAHAIRSIGSITRKSRLNDDVSNSATSEIEQVVRNARQTFGETLPKGFLSTEEYILYERLYGPPTKETESQDLDYLTADVSRNDVDPLRHGGSLLFRGYEDGELEEVDRNTFENGSQDGTMTMNEMELESSHTALQEGILRGASGSTDFIHAKVNSQRELDAVLQLKQDMENAVARPAEEDDIDEEVEEDDVEEEEEEGQEWEEEEEDEDQPGYITADAHRSHPNTLAGRSGTFPSTLSLPQEQFVLPITELLQRTHIKHLRESSEKAFGGPGLPYSTATPVSKKHLPQMPIGLEAGQHHMSEIEADAYLAGVTPGTYASVMSILVEVRKRLGSGWVQEMLQRSNGEGASILDAGAGGAGLVAWRQVLQTEWNILREQGATKRKTPPLGKSTVLTGSPSLRHRMSRFLDDTTFIPRLPDYVHSANSEDLLDGGLPQDRKKYDVIIASHTLLPLKDDFRRRSMVQNLWSMLNLDGGVLIFMEKGLPRGFEAVAEARSLLLERYISSPNSTHRPSLSESLNEEPLEKEPGMIIAPCTNHTTCPMYTVPGMSSGRKDFCHFEQRYIRPNYLQRVLGAKARNHDDVKYSYIAVRRGVDQRKPEVSSENPLVQGQIATDAAFAGHETEFENGGVTAAAGDVHPLSLPRAILSPLKRRGHVTLDLCTPSGTLERWTVPKSFSTQAYRDARKSRWGDLWALGAKTRVPRHLRLGRAQAADVIAKKGKKNRKGRDLQAVERKKRQGKNVFEVTLGEEGMERVRELMGSRPDYGERRTKRGRVMREKREIRDDEF